MFAFKDFNMSRHWFVFPHSYKDYRSNKDYSLTHQFWLICAMRFAFVILFEVSRLTQAKKHLKASNIFTPGVSVMANVKLTGCISFPASNTHSMLSSYASS